MTTKESFDTTIVMFEPCVGEELAEFRIREQQVTHTTVDANGTLHAHQVINDQGTRAVGVVTGRIWNQTGATVSRFNVSEAVTGNETFTNSFNLIGARRAAPDLRVQEVFHITVNRRGVVTVEFEKLRFTCTG